MTSSCTGMGCTNPSSSMARRISSLTPNSSNVFKFFSLIGCKGTAIPWMHKANALISIYRDTNINIRHRFDYQCQTIIIRRHYFLRTTMQEPTFCTHNKPKSVIRISLCRTAKRNPLIFSIWTRMIVVFLVIWPNIGYACLLFSPSRLALIAIRTELSSEISSCWN